MDKCREVAPECFREVWTPGPITFEIVFIEIDIADAVMAQIRAIDVDGGES